MDYRIVNRSSFSLLGKSICVSTKNGENLKQVPVFWQTCAEDGTIDKITSLNPEGRLIGVVAEYNELRSELTYLIAIETSTEQNIFGLSFFTIPASKWVVFSCIGPIPVSIQNLFVKIFSEWLPASNYIHGNAPELEVYPPGDPLSLDYKSEIWIPVLQKN